MEKIYKNLKELEVKDGIIMEKPKVKNDKESPKKDKKVKASTTKKTTSKKEDAKKAKQRKTTKKSTTKKPVKKSTAKSTSAKAKSKKELLSKAVGEELRDSTAMTNTQPAENLVVEINQQGLDNNTDDILETKEVKDDTKEVNIDNELSPTVTDENTEAVIQLLEEKPDFNKDDLQNDVDRNGELPPLQTDNLSNEPTDNRNSEIQIQETVVKKPKATKKSTSKKLDGKKTTKGKKSTKKEPVKRKKPASSKAKTDETNLDLQEQHILELEEVIKILKAKNEELNANIQVLVDENQQLQNEFTEIKKASTNEIIQQSVFDIDRLNDLSNDNEQMKTDLIQKDQIINDLQLQISKDDDEIHLLQTKVDDFQKKANDDQQSFRVISEENDRLQKEQETQKNQIISLQHSYEVKCKEFAQKCLDYQTQIASINDLLNEKDAELVALKNQKNNFEAEEKASRLESELEKAKEETELINTKIRDLSNENADLKVELDKDKKIIADLHNLVTSIKASNEQLQNDINRLNEEINDINNKNNDYVERYLSLETQYNELQKLQQEQNANMNQQTIEPNPADEYDGRNIFNQDLEDQIVKLQNECRQKDLEIAELKNNHDIDKYEKQIEILKQSLVSEKDENIKLHNLLENHEETIKEADNSFYQDKLDEQSQINANLARTIEAYKITLGAKTDEIISLKAEISGYQEHISKLDQQLANIKLAQNDNKSVESRLDELSSLVGNLSNQKQTPLYDNYRYDQERELRNLRDEIKARFDEQKQDRYLEEIRKLKDDIANITLKMNHEQDRKVVQGIVNQEIDNTQRQINNLEAKIENQTKMIANDELSRGIVYKKEDITSPQFKVEYDNYEKEISRLNFEIENDNEKFTSSVNKNNLAIERRYAFINEINNRLQNIVDNYNNSPEKGYNYKELYEQEKIKAAETIRFHNEKIRELLNTVSQATIRHNNYNFEKNHQIEVLRNKQQELIRYYYLKEKGLDRNSTLYNDLNNLQTEYEIKTQQLSALNEKTFNDDLQTHNEQSFFQPLHKYIDQAKDDKQLKIEELEEKVVNDNKKLEQIKDILNKYKIERDKRTMAEFDMRKSDDDIQQYYLNQSSINSLNQNLTQVTKKIESLLGELNQAGIQSNASEITKQLDELKVRKQDISSKIDYANLNSKKLLEDSEVQKYQQLLDNTSLINSRIETYMEQYRKLKKAIDDHSIELANLKTGKYA